MLKVYFLAFIYSKQNNRTKILALAEFIYKNIKNLIIYYILSKFYFIWYLDILFKLKVDL